MSQQMEGPTNFEDLGEEGDDGSLHDFWALTPEQIKELAALSDEDRYRLADMARGMYR